MDEARLAVLNAMSAADAGAIILTRTLCDSAQRRGGRWQATLCHVDGGSVPVAARALVNATGPWAARFLHQATGSAEAPQLVRRSTLLVRRKFTHGYGYRFQHPKGQTVFALPFEKDYTLIAASSQHYDGDPAGVAVTDEEIAALCSLVNRYFTAPASPADVVLAWSGAFMLPYGDPAQMADPWKYQLRLDGGDAPLCRSWAADSTPAACSPKRRSTALHPGWDTIGARGLPAPSCPAATWSTPLIPCARRWPSTTMYGCRSRPTDGHRLR